jgi:alkaline phosphatase
LITVSGSLPLDYVWNPDAIHKMKHSGSYMTEQIAKGKDPETVINEGYGVDFPKKQLDKDVTARMFHFMNSVWIPYILFAFSDG